MRILAIETSCDDTSVAITETSGRITSTGTPQIRVLSSVVSSQTELHTQFGGVVPNLARREHEKNLPFVLSQAIQKAGFLNPKSEIRNPKQISKSKIQKVKKMLVREPKLLQQLLVTPSLLLPPPIDAIAVTQGPGLEPALWVGVNAARALAVLWDKPLIAVNHMEGHLAAVLLQRESYEARSKRQEKRRRAPDSCLLSPDSSKVLFPAIGLLVSGGHTQLVLIKKWGAYKIIGETRDDAVGETFDKVARMLGLPYPGGPHIAALAEMCGEKKEETCPAKLRNERSGSIEKKFTHKLGDSKTEELIRFPRPMIHTKDYDFSYSGLKTAVLYYLRDNPRARAADVAASFQQAALDPLIEKTLRASTQYRAKTIIIGGGVAANDLLRATLTEKLTNSLTHKLLLFLPEKKLTTDNAAMIGAAAIFHASAKKFVKPSTLKAKADLRL